MKAMTAIHIKVFKDDRRITLKRAAGHEDKQLPHRDHLPSFHRSGSEHCLDSHLLADLFSFVLTGGPCHPINLFIVLLLSTSAHQAESDGATGREDGWQAAPLFCQESLDELQRSHIFSR